jgi:murein DD-endopeptidase MepM/ murein hydrolase activator NlpD
MHHATVAAAFLGLASLLPPQDRPASPDPLVLERGRECTRQFYAGELAALWPRFSAEMKAALVAESNLETFRKQVAEQVGAEAEVLREDVLPAGEHTSYRRRARFEKLEQPLLVTWSFDAEGTIVGFTIAPDRSQPAPSKYLDYETKTELRLPFAAGDEWYVFWGGREVAQNYHAAFSDQRFAYDLLAMKAGKSHTGSGELNEDYHCFGRTIVAPGAGVVVSVENAIEDNVPGKMNAAVPMGNHVIIDHGNGEFSFLAHFKQGSVAVEKGQKVAAGAVLGKSGNSGNSSEPHLHYHLQDAPEFGKGAGMPVFFKAYVADGEPVERGEPVRGQVLRVPG